MSAFLIAVGTVVVLACTIIGIYQVVEFFSDKKGDSK